MTLPTLAPTEACTGCSACRAACPRDAIAMAADGEGFLRPSVDAAKCVGCHACERACPVLAPGAADPAPTCFAARTRDGTLLRESSSGALFTELARPVLAAGGVVFGCVWDQGTPLTAIHAAAEDEAGLAAMRGSKYVQSDLRDTFREARAALRAGRRVLYTGTPCQIAGLLRFLGRPDPNLLAVEIICHSSASPAAFEVFQRTLARRLGARPVFLSFRDKAVGSWSWPALAWRLEDGRRGATAWYPTSYGRAFLSGLCTRPSCARCTAKAGASGADLTIGDFWGIGEACPRFDDGLGVSVVAAHTAAGRAVLDAIRPRLDSEPVSAEVAFRGNPFYLRPAPAHRQRAWFMARFRHCSFRGAVNYALGGPWPLRLARRAFHTLQSFIRSNTHSRGGGTPSLSFTAASLPAT